MLTTPRAQLIEKLITSPEGIVFRAVFLVYEEEGRIKARLVRAVPVSKKQNAIIFALAGESSNISRAEVASDATHNEIVSPYSSLLYFVGSKPRAPSFLA
ncbi:MAG: hypothetical protein RLY57_231 [Candidatus Parcubacteria bacterium]|jgi:hypothetical protein